MWRLPLRNVSLSEGSAPVAGWVGGRGGCEWRQGLELCILLDPKPVLVTPVPIGVMSGRQAEWHRGAGAQAHDDHILLVVGVLGAQCHVVMVPTDGVIRILVHVADEETNLVQGVIVHATEGSEGTRQEARHGQGLPAAGIPMCELLCRGGLRIHGPVSLVTSRACVVVLALAVAQACRLPSKVSRRPHFKALVRTL